MTQLTPAVSSNDHIRGVADAPVTLVKYGDFQCPYCAQAHAIVRRVQQEMGAEMRFVFRNFPVSAQPYATRAAEFAEVAGLQNNFWQTHDWLYTHQNSLDPSILRVELQSCFPDAKRMKRDRDQAQARVKAHIASGRQSGVINTPSFFINGQMFDSVWDYVTLLDAVQEAARKIKQPRILMLARTNLRA